MRKPPVPVDETARLASLHSLRILDSSNEVRFDRITRMARRVFGVDICLISLVDSHRQWFKSKQGLEATETPREVSFCGHAILKEDLLIVEDASEDPRFAHNPLVTGEPFIRFYAGCPIHGPGGHRIGTLCLIHPQQRQFSVEQQEILQDLGLLVEDELAVTAQATVDQLTKIANRRGFHTVAGHLLSLCRRTGTAAEVLFFDLDGLKAVNDRLGHDAGDRLLESFAKLLLKCFRSADVIARLGGDEFVVLLAGSDCASDAPLARLASLARGAETKLKDHLSWSVGRVIFDPASHSTVESLLAEADSAMCQDKSRKRANAR